MHDFPYTPTMNIENLTPTQLRKAADLQEKIEELQHELAELDGGEIPIPFFKAKQGPKPGKRKMSASAKAKIAAAQKKRWATFHAKTKPAAKAEKKGPKKRGMSAEGKAKIATAQKLRWSKVKAAKKAEAPAKSEAKPGKRKMSAAGRAAIAAGARARWAKIKAAGKTSL